MVCPQEPECQGEYDEVAQEQADHEHDERAGHDAERVVPLAGIERGGDEAESHVKHEGGGTQEGGVEGDFHVGDELSGKPGVNKFHTEGGHRLKAEGGGHAVYEAIGDETAIARCKHYIEQRPLETEGHKEEREDDDGHSQEVAPHHIEMLPERHGLGGVRLFFHGHSNLR